MALTRIGTDNISDMGVQKADIKDNAVDAYKLDVSTWNAGDILSVNLDGTLTFVPPSAGGGIPKLGELTDVELTNLANGELIAYDLTEQKWKNVAPDSVGISTFTGLTDTPTNFIGASGQVARVNVGETALEFTALANVAFSGDYNDLTNQPPAGVSTFVGLSDTPADYTGQNGNIVAVNGTGNGLEYINTINGGSF